MKKNANTSHTCKDLELFALIGSKWIQVMSILNWGKDVISDFVKTPNEKQTSKQKKNTHFFCYEIQLKNTT